VTLLHADSIYSVEQTTTSATVHNFAALPTGDSLIVVATAPNTDPYYGKVYITGNTAEVGTVAATTVVSVYPNPATNVVHVKGIEENAGYRCMDIAGRLMLEGQISKTNNRIDTKALAPGSYILQIVTKTGKTSLPLQVLR
jgi:hypothetical protein